MNSLVHTHQLDEADTLIDIFVSLILSILVKESDIYQTYQYLSRVISLMIPRRVGLVVSVSASHVVGRRPVRASAGSFKRPSKMVQNAFLHDTQSVRIGVW